MDTKMIAALQSIVVNDGAVGVIFSPNFVEQEAQKRECLGALELVTDDIWLDGIEIRLKNGSRLVFASAPDSFVRHSIVNGPFDGVTFTVIRARKKQMEGR